MKAPDGCEQPLPTWQSVCSVRRVPSDRAMRTRVQLDGPARAAGRVAPGEPGISSWITRAVLLELESRGVSAAPSSSPGFAQPSCTSGSSGSTIRTVALRESAVAMLVAKDMTVADVALHGMPRGQVLACGSAPGPAVPGGSARK